MSTSPVDAELVALAAGAARGGERCPWSEGGVTESRQPLMALWRACAPQGWTVTGVEARASQGNVLLRDPDGRAHELTWEPLVPTRPALHRGRRLAFAYRLPPEGGPSPVEVYRETLLRAADREDELAALETKPLARESEPPLFITESSLWLTLARELPRARSIRGAAERWLARMSSHELILYFEAPCRQACEFCEEPPLRTNPIHRGERRLIQLRQRTPLDLVASGAFGALLDGLARRRPTPRLTIMGHDWLEHPRRDELLGAIEARPGLRLRCHGPSTQLADTALASRVARLPGLESIGLTLEACDPRVHDAIVGAPGSGAAVMRAIDVLSKLGARLQVTVVLSKRALPTLAETVQWVSARGLHVVLQAFIPDRDLRAAGSVLAPINVIAAALGDIDAGARAAVDSVVGLPWCAVPGPLRARLSPALAGEKREPLVHPAPCSGCSMRARCPGVPASYVAALGHAGLSPC